MKLALYVRPFATQDLIIGLCFFLIFLHEFRDSWSEGWRSSIFEKKQQWVKSAQKVSKMAQKLGSWDIDKNKIYSYLCILVEYESTNNLQTFCRNHMSRENLISELSKNLHDYQKRISIRHAQK